MKPKEIIMKIIGTIFQKKQKLGLKIEEKIN